MEALCGSAGSDVRLDWDYLVCETGSDAQAPDRMLGELTFLD